VFKWITIPIIAFVGALSMLSIHKFHQFTNNYHLSEGAPWALGPVTFEDLAFSFAPAFLFMFAALVARSTIPKILVSFSIAIYFVLVMLELGVADPQHGSEKLAALWLVQILVGLITFILSGVGTLICFTKRK
jgi:hypothetical protein